MIGRVIMKEMMKIGTHNGAFHCDEVLACAMLKQLPEYKDAEIIRSRDQAELDKCHIVVDVGGIFDKATHRYTKLALYSYIMYINFNF